MSASKINSSNSPLTLNEWFADAVDRYGKQQALNIKVKGTWNSYTYLELQSLVDRMACGFMSLGIEKGDRIAILSENRPEWVISDLAALAVGAVVVPIYPTLPPVQTAHILRDSGACAIITSDVKQLGKSKEAASLCDKLRLFIAMDDPPTESTALSFSSILGELDLNIESRAALDKRRTSVGPGDLASLVYTSGTTGNPKGAMLSHGNIVAAARTATQALPVAMYSERFLSFLPLCHIYERIVCYVCLGIGANIFYAESIFKVMDNMAETHPTVMQSVPRMFEAIHDRILDVISRAPRSRQSLFHWAMEVGDRWSSRAYAGKFVNPILAVQRAIADRLVLRKLRKPLGGSIRLFVSGGAPLRDETATFFNSIGVPVLEAYGMTETAATISTNRWGKAKVGTVGFPFPAVELTIAGDGEIMVKGDNIMQGYWNDPDATAQVLNSDGWLHTGDIGRVDSDGYVKITDRKKDILVLANGKNVAPQPIEHVLKQSRLIQEIVLLEDSGGVSAIVVPDFAGLSEWAKDTGIDAAGNTALAAHPLARREIKKQIDAQSADLADYEKVRRFVLLDHGFSIENDELTPTLKVKRKVIRERYGSLIG